MITVQTTGPGGPSPLEQLELGFRRPNPQTLTRLALLVHRDALANAPITPTQQTLNKLHGRKRTVHRKATAYSRPKPGGLMRSIAYRVGLDTAEIYVAANSEAGKYAFRMHEEKGKTWWNRGPGTVAKGTRADHKFIERAITENQPRIREALLKGGPIQ